MSIDRRKHGNVEGEFEVDSSSLKLMEKGKFEVEEDKKGKRQYVKLDRVFHVDKDDKIMESDNVLVISAHDGGNPNRQESR